MIEAVSTMYRAVGMEAPLQTWDPGTFTAKTRAHEFDRHLGFTASPNTDPLLQFNLYNTRLTANRTLAAETRSVDAGYEASVRELDEAKREQLFRAVGTVWCMPFQRAALLAAQRNGGGPEGGRQLHGARDGAGASRTTTRSNLRSGHPALEATNARDYQVVQAVTLWGAAMFIFINLGVDLLYGWIDPRVRR